MVVSAVCSVINVHYCSFCRNNKQMGGAPLSTGPITRKDFFYTTLSVSPSLKRVFENCITLWCPHLWLNSWRTLLLQYVCMQQNCNWNEWRLNEMLCSAGNCTEKIHTESSIVHDANSHLFCRWIRLQLSQMVLYYKIVYEKAQQID